MQRLFIALLSLALFVIVSQSGCDKEVIPESTVPDASVVPVIPVPQGPRRRVLILPMSCYAAAKSHCAFGLGLPAVLTERLESDPNIEPINTPQVLSTEQASLLPADRDVPIDLVAANTLALAKNAEVFVLGAFGKHTWKWVFEIRIYAAHKEGPEIIGTNDASIGDPSVETSILGAKNDVGGLRMHQVYAAAVAKAFVDADMPLADATKTALETPDTKNGYAFLLLSRAYVAHFTGRETGDKMPSAKDGDSPDDQGIARAAHAVVVDPKNAPAQRFYAGLQLAAGKIRSARVHYEAALKLRPNDIRVLLGLGGLEVADGNADVAKRYLAKVTAMHPQHAHAHALLAKATLALGDTAGAIVLYERARDLAPSQPVPHSALLELYADASRYADSAKEAEALTNIYKGDPKPWYLLGANLRAAGLRDQAISAYAKGATRFPKEWMLSVFRGDILREDGRKDEAKAAYQAGSVASWYNERLEGIIKEYKFSPFLGGNQLVSAIEKNSARLDGMKTSQADFSLGINDATLEYRAFKEAACMSGAGASSAKFARAAAELYHQDASALATDAWRIKETFKNREYLSLTTDELVRARQVIAAWWPATLAWREMRTAWRRSYLPAVARADCPPSSDGTPIVIEDTTRERIQARLASRIVALPEVAPPLYGIPISPSIPPRTADMVSFTVDNREGGHDRQIWLDGTSLGVITKGTIGPFTAPKGPHSLCIAPVKVRCGDPGTLRNKVTLHERWTITMRPGG